MRKSILPRFLKRRTDVAWDSRGKQRAWQPAWHEPDSDQIELTVRWRAGSNVWGRSSTFSATTWGNSMRVPILSQAQRHCEKLQRWPANFTGGGPMMTHFRASPFSRALADDLFSIVKNGNVVKKKKKSNSVLFLLALLSNNFKDHLLQ